MNMTDLLAKLENKEFMQQFTKRCIAVDMCPECGSDTTSEMDRTGDIDVTCTKCSFTGCK